MDEELKQEPQIESEPLTDKPIQEEPQFESESLTDKPKKSGWKYELLDLLKTFAICFIVVFLLTRFVINPVRVDGESMHPTLEDEELGLMNVFSKKVFGVKRFDVVVVYNEKYREDWVKRIIGMPGDSIYAKDDKVYINGKPISEPYLNNEYANKIRDRGENFTLDFDKVTLGDDEYFLMGDNRVYSLDSRVVGPFKKDDIIGKDVYVFYPFNKMKIVGNGE